MPTWLLLTLGMTAWAAFLAYVFREKRQPEPPTLCPGCGEPLLPDDRQCPMCGHEL